VADPDPALLTAVRRRARALDSITVSRTASRDEAIRAAAAAGFSRRAIAAAAGVTFQRVQQIVHSDSGRASNAA
jgi:hypothetical protein